MNSRRIGSLLTKSPGETGEAKGGREEFAPLGERREDTVEKRGELNVPEKK